MDDRRRRVLRGVFALAAGPALAARPAIGQGATARVAAIQFNPKVGDVAANLSRAEGAVQDALSKGARWIVLPEFFSSGLMLHPAMLQAHRAVDGEPAQFLVAMAKKGGAYVGGTFLVRSGDDVFNTFVLACPDGTTFAHDKDFPSTSFESSLFAGSEDAAYVARLKADGARVSEAPIAPRAGQPNDGAFGHGGHAIGVAACWEIARPRTARRLRGKVDILLAASGWWTIDPAESWPGVPPQAASQRWAEHKALIESAPVRFARMLGVPVVHANFSGPNHGFTSTAFQQAAKGRFLGGSRVVDASGRVLAALGLDEGIAVADVRIAREPPTEEPGDAFWLPEMTPTLQRSWSSSGAAGREYYIAERRRALAAAR